MRLTNFRGILLRHFSFSCKVCFCFLVCGRLALKGVHDCDDEDSSRYPGNTEVCDLETPSHDEDCDPKTFGKLDEDGDSYTDARCRNRADDGTVYQGADCDDTSRVVNPDNSEVYAVLRETENRVREDYQNLLRTLST